MVQSPRRLLRYAGWLINLPFEMRTQRPINFTKMEKGIFLTHHCLSAGGYLFCTHYWQRRPHRAFTLSDCGARRKRDGFEPSSLVKNSSSIFVALNARSILITRRVGAGDATSSSATSRVGAANFDGSA